MMSSSTSTKTHAKHYVKNSIGNNSHQTYRHNPPTTYYTHELLHCKHRIHWLSAWVSIVLEDTFFVELLSILSTWPIENFDFFPLQYSLIGDMCILLSTLIEQWSLSSLLVDSCLVDGFLFSGDRLELRLELL